MIQFNLYVVKFERNHYIQDIDEYLSNCEKLYSDYNKIINRDFLEDKTNVTLKIITDDISKKLKGFNYLRMEDEDSTRVRYYFIDNMKYLNDGTTQITATLDPVNSFQTYINNENNFKRVQMKRRHKNRFSQSGYRIFDKVDEGFGDVSVAELEQGSVGSTPSNIIYMQPTTTSNDTVINTTSLIKRMWRPTTSAKSISVRRYKYELNKSVMYDSSGNVKFNYKSGRMLFFNDYKNYSLSVIINKQDSKIKTLYADAALFRVTDYTNPNSLQVTITLFSYDNYKFTVVKNVVVDGYECNKDNPDSIAVFFTTSSGKVDDDRSNKNDITLNIGDVFYSYELSNGSASYIGGADVTISVKPLNVMNMHDSQLKQIVEIPFIPRYDDLVCINDTSGTEEVVFKDNVDSAVLYSQKVQIPDEWMNISIPTETTTKDIYYETKLYGSQCRSYYLAYDNNTMVLQPEYRNEADNYLLVKSVAPLNMSNNLAFYTSGFESRKPFDNWLICGRNNNVTIYSNEYLNYIRTGYNYDVKNKQQQSVKNWVSFGVGIASSAASIAGGVASKAGSAGLGGYLLGSAVGSSLGTINSLTNNILAEQANEQALEQKKQQAMNATVNVSGSDDLALFHQYSGNYLRFVSTRPNEDIQQAQYQLFYEFGYADNTTYEVMPKYHTRGYFNYVQADIGHALPDDYIPTEHINEVVDAFRNGITFEWHGTRGWKLDNESYENYELF